MTNQQTFQARIRIVDITCPPMENEDCCTSDVNTLFAKYENDPDFVKYEEIAELPESHRDSVDDIMWGKASRENWGRYDTISLVEIWNPQTNQWE